MYCEKYFYEDGYNYIETNSLIFLFKRSIYLFIVIVLVWYKDWRVATLHVTLFLIVEGSGKTRGLIYIRTMTLQSSQKDSKKEKLKSRLRDNKLIKDKG